MNRPILGLIETVKIAGEEVKARIDTGAEISSLCQSLASRLPLTAPIKEITIKSSNGKEKRPVVEAELEIRGQTVTAQFTLTNRTHLKYKALVGLNVLKAHNFLIDPTL